MSKTRYPKIIEKGKCRGCGQPVPKGRMTWCSNECFHTHEPHAVRCAVWKRDKGICQLCGINIARMERKGAMAHGAFPDVNYAHPRFRPHGLSGGPFLREAYEEARRIRVKHKARWYAAAEKSKKALKAAGWPAVWRGWWEMDHIVPHSDGGKCVLENMRTLCVPCHKKRTAEWHKERAMAKRRQKAGPDLFDLAKK